jgi:carbon storage regulator
MLVLSRKTGQRLLIGPNIQVAVLSVQGGRVRLGIQAPEDVSVHRQEVHERFKDQGRHGEPPDVHASAGC